MHSLPCETWMYLKDVHTTTAARGVDAVSVSEGSGERCVGEERLFRERERAEEDCAPTWEKAMRPAGLAGNLIEFRSQHHVPKERQREKAPLPSRTCQTKGNECTCTCGCDRLTKLRCAPWEADGFTWASAFVTGWRHLCACCAPSAY